MHPPISKSYPYQDLIYLGKDEGPSCGDPKIQALVLHLPPKGYTIKHPPNMKERERWPGVPSPSTTAQYGAILSIHLL